MPDGKKKMISSKETGTVPKVRYWNNTASPRDTHVSNNLTMSMLTNQDRPLSESRNQQRCSNYHCFEGLCVDDTRNGANFNSLPYMNMSGGTTSPSTSGSTSRRQSSGSGAIRKCDNITKYPDKKHIEDKLNQIREYLKITSVLMSRVKEDSKTSEENNELYQMLSALQDSEKKLEALLANREIDESEVLSNHVVEQTEPSENGIPTLDTDTISNQNNVCQRNDLEQKMHVSEKKLDALHAHQSLLMQLQEKAENQLQEARRAQERLAAQANASQFALAQQMLNNSQAEPKNSEKNMIIQSDVVEPSQAELTLLQATPEGRGQLLRLLDTRDNELCEEQQALQQKLQDLTIKKRQVDDLVSQLHSFGVDVDNETEEGDDTANQIRNIVAMKEQLATLKDMLSAVKSTEASLVQQNSVERSEFSEQITVVKTENIPKAASIGFSDSEARSEPDRCWNSMGKQSNKSSISSSREQLQAELQAKKQELEELMYKDQDRTSAINQDVCNELVMNKAEQSFSIESVPSSWTLLQDNSPPRDSCVSRENVYSSDEEDLENYSQLNNVDDASKVSDYVNCGSFGKHIPNRPVLRENGTATPSVCQQNFNATWNGGEHKQQLELMTNLCQSLLDQQRQVLPNQCSPPNFQWYTSYMQMQQALMLSTISQCCQLLWVQQQDINNLISTVSMMQQQQQVRSKPPQCLNVSPPTNETVPSACSLPTRLPSNNTEYASLAPRDRVSPQNLTRNLPSSVMSQHSQPHPTVWNGAPALNNQVAPGNRANNYWDNFRSYSRQNLLSSSAKTNEGSQNSISLLERSNAGAYQPIGSQRTQPLVKINMPIQEVISTADLRDVERSSSRPKPKRNRTSCRNRNEWSGDTPQTENSPHKSKLFEVLRENVYQEVTTLISANENRPHFLIQLFRDLQLISSDPLRQSALQSIQSLISRSLADATSIPNHCPVGLEQSNSQNRRPEVQSQSLQSPQLVQTSATASNSACRNKSEKSRCCPQMINSVENMENIKLELSAQFIVMDLMRVLRTHNDEAFNHGLIQVIKKMILEHCKSSSSNNKLQTKLDLIFNEMLVKYKGKLVMDIKEDLLKTITDILLEEMIASETVKDQQNISDQQNHIPNQNITKPVLFLSDHNYSFPLEFMEYDAPRVRPNFSNIPRVDNGDLAEADQSRREAENEEGAVGGLLENQNGRTSEHEVPHGDNALHSQLDFI